MTEQQRELWQRYLDSGRQDFTAEGDLMASYWRLVRWFASKLQRRYWRLDGDEILSLVAEGFLRCMRWWKPGGRSYVTCAKRWAKSRVEQVSERTGRRVQTVELLPQHEAIPAAGPTVLEEAIEKLEPQEQMVIVGRYHYGYQPAELAELAGVSVASIKRRHQQVLWKLRHALSDGKAAAGLKYRNQDGDLHTCASRTGKDGRTIDTTGIGKRTIYPESDEAVAPGCRPDSGVIQRPGRS